MVFIKRDKDGEISGVSRDHEPGFDEEIQERSGELTAFLHSSQNSAELANSDLEFIRVIDDLVEVLIAKGLISFTDLPPSAQEKLLKRSELRSRWRESLDLLGDEGNYLIGPGAL